MGKKSLHIYVLYQSSPHSATVSTQPFQRYYDDINVLLPHLNSCATETVTGLASQYAEAVFVMR